MLIVNTDICIAPAKAMYSIVYADSASTSCPSLMYTASTGFFFHCGVSSLIIIAAVAEIAAFVCLKYSDMLAWRLNAPSVYGRAIY